LKFVTILETGWVFTDVSGSEYKIKLNIQKEALNSVKMTKEMIITFEKVKIQCQDCRKSFTPHLYVCKVQVRQNCIPKENKRNMLFLEQLIIKHNAHIFCSSIDTFHEGVDFKFTDVK